MNTTKGRSRGVGYVRFSTEEEAEAAIATLDGAEMDGRELKVDKWTTPDEDDEHPRSRPAFAGKANGKSGKGRPESPFNAFSPRPAAAGKSGGKAKGKGKSKDREDDDRMVYVANLPFSAQWQEIKDHFG